MQVSLNACEGHLPVSLCRIGVGFKFVVHVHPQDYRTSEFPLTDKIVSCFHEYNMHLIFWENRSDLLCSSLDK